MTVAYPKSIAHEQFEKLYQLIRGVIRHDADSERLHLVWRLNATGLVQAAQEASSMAAEALGASLGSEAELTSLQVVTAEEADAERDHPRPQELMGYTEAAAELDVSRQRVAQLDGQHPDFPRPIGRVGAGPVFTAESIRSFAARWNRSPGRRKIA
ncbi:hypothetical protein [Peterkaempfera bronchialis]|uniref:hypothetical protein n=1 Tax=Peterkaempfera bronchialis TaxID=2126346 RepID=UPI0013B3C771|nr:hypothetical protein [Peterkaempfera bronchialis]